MVLGIGRLRHLGLYGIRCITIMNDFVSPGPEPMASRRNRPINLPAPYLKRIWLEPSKIADREAYPFCLPFCCAMILN